MGPPTDDVVTGSRYISSSQHSSSPTNKVGYCKLQQLICHILPQKAGRVALISSFLIFKADGLHENNFTELFDNLGILGEYQSESANLLGAASDVVAKRRAKKYGDKIAAPDEDDTASYRDWEFKGMKSMSDRKGRKRLKNVAIKILQ